METEHKSAGFCTLCRNRCSLDNPKCPQVLTDEMLQARCRQTEKAAVTCQICQNHCSIGDLKCEIGRTIHRVRKEH